MQRIYKLLLLSVLVFLINFSGLQLPQLALESDVLAELISQLKIFSVTIQGPLKAGTIKY
ncbi:MAG: hypothetical protein ACJAXE_000444 [Neolewinella sp.]